MLINNVNSLFISEIISDSDNTQRTSWQIIIITDKIINECNYILINQLTILPIKDYTLL